MSPFLTAVNDLILSEQLPAWAYSCTQEKQIQVITKENLYKEFGGMSSSQAMAIQEEIICVVVNLLNRKVVLT